MSGREELRALVEALEDFTALSGDITKALLYKIYRDRDAIILAGKVHEADRRARTALTRAESSLASPAGMEGWMPIETAPKDGTKFQAWAEGYEWPEVIFWESYDRDTAEEVGEPGYFRYADGVLADIAEVEQDLLTHWMPLPAAPRGESE